MQEYDKDGEFLEGMSSESFREVFEASQESMQKDLVSSVRIGKFPREGESFTLGDISFNVSTADPESGLVIGSLQHQEKNPPILPGEIYELNGLKFKVSRISYAGTRVNLKFME